MASTVYSFTITGVDGHLIEVEADTISGQQVVSIVGLGDTAIKESKERLESAITYASFHFPEKKMIINLAPSHMKKMGSHFDLAMAIALLMRTNQIEVQLASFALIGELSLNAKIRSVTGVLPMAISAKENGIRHFIVPNDNVEEAALVKGIEVIGCCSLQEAIDILQRKQQSPTILTERKTTPKSRNPTDFSDVKGQNILIEYLAVAAAGGHNMMMIGPPGCGKSMLAKRVPTILPPMTEQEALEITKIYSVSKLLKEGGLVTERPFRAPHHNASTNSLIGGGNRSLPGEISLAHHGVLFLDEIAEFQKKTLEALRQPMEDRQVTISRVQQTNTYPANFMLIAAMNPCPCGYFGQEKCRCTDYEVIKYRNKISGPMLDRIDIQKYVQTINFFENEEHGESSADIREKVAIARERQQKRYQDDGITCNAELTPALIKKFCQLDTETETLLKKAYEHYQYSGRTIHKFIKVARTFADLNGDTQIQKQHVMAALHSRDLDRERKNLLIM
ncbi:YifB family Mg chelatase-like AAA ATPase [Bacillus sp. FJAT-45350]|uniref:YifB family Mg chelatase-like AAA ATPase n=1 Tax=Bacillus sp. FJAT-45350 TaxID=2011014 RepID=UPI000BB7B5AB|nr:YifB family Mg chelatase-like AAA ATPase [Bacillus sp. FJAT-45350]